MEQNHRHSGGAVLNTSGARFRHQRSPPSSERFLGIFDPPKSSSLSSSPPVELSEHDIFSVSSSSSPSPIHRSNTIIPKYSSPSPTRQSGILTALAESNSFSPRSGFGSKSSAQSVLHRKVSSSSLSSSPSTSSRISIPRRPLPPVAQDRVFLRHQSAPTNVPAAMRRRVRDMEEVLLEEEEEEENGGVGMMLPPHELVDARNSQMLACSVLEGAGRTLKGRDLRQVRNAIWRRTGFIH